MDPNRFAAPEQNYCQIRSLSAFAFIFMLRTVVRECDAVNFIFDQHRIEERDRGLERANYIAVQVKTVLCDMKNKISGMNHSRGEIKSGP